MKTSKNVNEYISSNKQWSAALKKLISILLKTELKETIMWSSPVYTYNKNNILRLGEFKSYEGLWFFQGALLKDKKKKLVNAQ